ncbi:hypothetical protein EMCRGX_G016135 [Ephydatia muelleri]
MEPIKEFSRTVLSLDNCIIPTERLLETPSIKDGMSHDLETDLRIVGCEYIQSAGMLLRLPQVAMATAQVLFQRYYYSKSFVKYHIQHMAMACLFLSSKIEEDCRRLRDVINVFHHLKQKRMGSHLLAISAMAQLAGDPLSSLKVSSDWLSRGLMLDSFAAPQLRTEPIEPMEYMGEEYFKSKNTVIKYERYLLKELGFCVHVKHPHKLIITYLQILGLEKNATLGQKAWNFMNDSLRTNVFVRYSPETIACACISLAARQLQIPLPQKPAWWLLFDAEYKDIQTICKELTALYLRPMKQLEDLENEVGVLREELTKKQIEIKEVNLKLELPGSMDSPNPTSPSVHVVTQSQLSSRGTSSQPTSDAHKGSHGSGDDEKGSKNTPPVENGQGKPFQRSRSPVSPHKDTTSDHSHGTTPQAYKSIDGPIRIGNEDSGSELVNSPPSLKENGLPKRYSKDYENDRDIRKKRHSRHKERRERHHRSASREHRHRHHREKEHHKVERIVSYTDRERDHERDYSSRPYNRHR